MFITDIRSMDLLLGGVSVIVAVLPAQAAENYAVGICQTATQSAGAEIRPTYAAGDYLFKYHGNDPRYKAKLASGEFFSGAKVTLNKAPEHGKVVYADNPKAVKWNWFDYMPKDGYVDQDRFVILVEKDGVKVRIEYLIEGINDDDSIEGVCDQASWKISAIQSTFDDSSSSQIRSIT